MFTKCSLERTFGPKSTSKNTSQKIPKKCKKTQKNRTTGKTAKHCIFIFFEPGGRAKQGETEGGGEAGEGGGGVGGGGEGAEERGGGERREQLRWGRRGWSAT